MSCSASRSTPRRASPSLRRKTRHVGSCRAFAGGCLADWTEKARQMDLFSPPVESKASPLYKAIDAINAHYGKGKVFSASEGIGERSWKMKRSKLSKRASTRWDELLVVR